MPSSQLARPQQSSRVEHDAASAYDVGSLYREHAAQVARWASRLGGQNIDVEDVVHQVFLVAQRRLPAFRGDAKITTWLHGITVRVVQETRRRQKRWWRWVGARSSMSMTAGQPLAAEDDDASLLGAAVSDQPSALELLESKEAGQLVYAILDQLDEKYRTVLILFELEGASGQEIAVMTKTSVANVWVRLVRGREQFIKRFSAWEARSRRAHESEARSR